MAHPLPRMTDVEAVLLTGGASRRMGRDKASLLIDGEPMAIRIARELLQATDRVTVLGREPIEGCRFVRDVEEYQGPMAALANFKAERPYVFIASCDLPFFNAGILPNLAKAIDGDGAIPQYLGRLQPLCALYRASSLTLLRELHAEGEKRIMAWIDLLEVVAVESGDEVRNVNLPEELP